jgi:NTE family protein
MGTKQLAPGFYSTSGNALGDEEQEVWEGQDRLPKLDTVQRSSKYGNCVALSGGGYRAALFHLGVLRRLNEVGMLGNIDTFACVSGGSIIGAILANTIRKNPEWWPKPGDTISLKEWEERFAGPVRLAMEKDIRTKAILGGLPIQGLNRAVQVVENQLTKRLDEARLQDLPQHPQFLFCASELERGDYWIFGRGHIGPYGGPFKMVMPHYPLARAVAASACFPPVFLPQRTDFVD